jgi:hypothetical protein
MVVSTSQPTLAPAQEPGSAMVTVSEDAANSPQATAVRMLVQTYFNAVNAKNYDLWLTVVTNRLARSQPKSTFEQGYRTTRDGTIEIVRIDTTPGSDLRVLLTFHSTQNAQDAPSNSPYSCLTWQVVWPVVHDSSGALRTDQSVGSDPNVPLRQKCAA